MTFTLFPYDSIHLQGGLSVEILNKPLFLQVVSSLWNGVEGNETSERVTILNGERPVSLGLCLVISDLFGMKWNDRKLMTKIVGDIGRLISEDVEASAICEKLFVTLCDLVKQKTIDYEIDLCYNETVKVEEWVKLLCPQISFRSSTPLDKVYTLLDVNAKFKLYSVLFFVGFKNYLEKDTLQEVLKYALATENTVIFLDNVSFPRMLEEHKLVIEEDFTETII